MLGNIPHTGCQSPPARDPYKPSFTTGIHLDFGCKVTFSANSSFNFFSSSAASCQAGSGGCFWRMWSGSQGGPNRFFVDLYDVMSHEASVFSFILCNKSSCAIYHIYLIIFTTAVTSVSLSIPVFRLAKAPPCFF